MNQFVDRTEELDRLQAFYGSDSAELAIVYGRRQIGKSELVRRSIGEREDGVSYQAIQGTPTTQIRRSSRRQRRCTQASQRSRKSGSPC